MSAAAGIQPSTVSMEGWRPAQRTPGDAGRYFWTNHEEAILREHYPGGGPRACEPLLPRRTTGAIYQHASAMGLKTLRFRGDFRQRHGSSPIFDDMIRRAYESRSVGAIRDLSKTIGRPRWWVRRRALKLGIAVPRFKEPAWSEAEHELLAQHAHKTPTVIALIFRKHGYRRTEAAIVNKIKRRGFDTLDPNHFTARGAALVMGVDCSTVTSWIEKGWLKAKRRGTARLPCQGGDHHWIHRRELRAFIVDNAARVDLRKVDKFWFIDFLVSG